MNPTKKQRELLLFIDGFIKGNGYGPSYREIMRALDYKSVSTVATHVDGLIARGLLQKRDKSARSLEVIDPSQRSRVDSENKVAISVIKKKIKQLKDCDNKNEKAIKQLESTIRIISQ